MSRLHIADSVVLFLELDQHMGTFNDLTKGKIAYINNWTMQIIQHLMAGKTLESFFPDNLDNNRKQKMIQQSEQIICELKDNGFITSEEQVPHGIIKTIATNPPLRVSFIELTKQCNLRCKHCYVPDCSDAASVFPHTLISSEDITNLIYQLDELGVMEIQLTGGEPFLLPYMLDIIRILQERLIPCSLFTNGTLISEEVFAYLSTNHKGMIFYISLDGFQETHNAFRGGSQSFQKTVHAIKKLLRMGCDVRINTTVGRHNYPEMRQFSKFIKNEFGILHRLVNIEPMGRASTNMGVTDEEFSSLLKDTGNSLVFLDNHDSSLDWSMPPCGVGSSMLFVDAYGNVSFCPTLTQETNAKFLTGNIKNESIKDIWENSPVFRGFRGAQCRLIESCSFKEKCKGGCRRRAYTSTGDINSPDTAMCKLYNEKCIA